MSIANTAYFANGFAVGGMMDRCWNCGDYVDENGKGCLCDRMKSELIELRRRNAELEGMYKCACSEADSILKDLRKCEAKNAELERELADIKESYRNVLAEPCESDDRVHCTCVPALRAALATKQTEVNKEQAEADRLRLVLVQISSWGCNGQCVELVGTQCPCCIAKAALKEVDGGKETPRVG